MLDDKTVAILIGVVGLVIGFGLWAFRIVPWWGVLVSAVAAPVAVVVLLLAVCIFSWMASGSH